MNHVQLLMPLSFQSIHLNASHCLILIRHCLSKTRRRCDCVSDAQCWQVSNNLELMHAISKAAHRMYKDTLSAELVRTSRKCLYGMQVHTHY